MALLSEKIKTRPAFHHHNITKQKMETAFSAILHMKIKGFI